MHVYNLGLLDRPAQLTETDQSNTNDTVVMFKAVLIRQRKSERNLHTTLGARQHPQATLFRFRRVCTGNVHQA